jgi:hypothetical protein
MPKDGLHGVISPPLFEEVNFEETAPSLSLSPSPNQEELEWAVGEASQAAKAALEGAAAKVTGNQAFGTALDQGMRGSEVLAHEMAQIDAAVQRMHASARRLGVPEVDLARVINKSNHIFGLKNLERHRLRDFLQTFGGDTVEAYKTLENATQELVNQGHIQEEIFERNVTVRATIITVRCRIVDGVVKINTAFIPRS